MEIKDFSSEEAIKFGWGATKTNFWFIFGVFVVIVLIAGFFSVCLEQVDNQGISFAIINLGYSIVQVFMTMGAIQLGLMICDNKPPRTSVFFENNTLFVNYVVGTFLYGLIVFLGTLLLVIPGIIWAIKYQFVGHIIVDLKIGPLEALKKSAQITRDEKFPLLILSVILGIINFAGALAFGIGLLATIPTTGIAHIYVYRSLLERKA